MASAISLKAGGVLSRYFKGSYFFSVFFGSLMLLMAQDSDQLLQDFSILALSPLINRYNFDSRKSTKRCFREVNNTPAIKNDTIRNPRIRDFL